VYRVSQLRLVYGRSRRRLRKPFQDVPAKYEYKTKYEQQSFCSQYAGPCTSSAAARTARSCDGQAHTAPAHALHRAGMHRDRCASHREPALRAERHRASCRTAHECHTRCCRGGPHSCAVVRPARDARQRAGATRPTAIIYEGEVRGFGVHQGVNDSADPLVRQLAVGCLLACPLGACASARPDGPVPLSARPILACILCLRDR